MKRTAALNKTASELDGGAQSGHNFRGTFAYARVCDLKVHPLAPRKHSRQQRRAIASSMRRFGVNAPILITRDYVIVAGVGRFEAAKLLGLKEVPVVFLDHLDEVQAKAYMLADNKLTDRSSWDDSKVATILKELSELAIDFDIEDTGFEPAEIDLRIQSLEDVDAADRADEFEFAEGTAITGLGDTWFAGDHRVHCGNSLEDAAYADFFPDEKAVAAFADAPYNVKIDGHVSGTGKIQHREFAMGVGEMSRDEFTQFLGTALSQFALTPPPRH